MQKLLNLMLASMKCSEWEKNCDTCIGITEKGTFSTAENFGGSRNGNTTEFALWIERQTDENALELCALLAARNTVRSNQLYRTVFRDGSAALKELGTEYVKQVMRIAIALYGMSQKDARIGELYTNLVVTGVVPATMLVGSSFLATTMFSTEQLNRRNKKSKFPLHKICPLEVILVFHSVCTLSQPSEFAAAAATLPCLTKNSRSPLKKKAGIVRRCMTRETIDRIACTVQTLTRAWDALAARTASSSDDPRTYEELLSPYILFDPSSSTFSVLHTRADGFAPATQCQTLYQNDDNNSNSSGAAHKREDCSSSAAWDRCSRKDAAMRHITGLFFHHLHSALQMGDLYTIENQGHLGLFLRAYRVPENLQLLPSCFKELPGFVKDLLGLQVDVRRSMSNKARSSSRSSRGGDCTAGRSKSEYCVVRRVSNAAPASRTDGWASVDSMKSLENDHGAVAGTDMSDTKNNDDYNGALERCTSTAAVGRCIMGSQRENFSTNTIGNAFDGTNEHINGDWTTIELQYASMQGALGDFGFPPTAGEHEQHEQLAALESDLEFKYMQPYCRIYDVSFDELMTCDESGFYESIENFVQLIITEPPSGSQQEVEEDQVCADRRGNNSFSSSSSSSYMDCSDDSEDEDSNRECARELCEEDMKRCVRLWDTLLRPGGHGVVFCTQQQFYKWKYLLETYGSCSSRGSLGGDHSDSYSTDKNMRSADGQSPDMECNTSVSSRDEIDNRSGPVFFVESAQLVFLPAPTEHAEASAADLETLYKRMGDGKRNLLSHVNIWNGALHFWKQRGADQETSANMVCYKLYGHVKSPYSAHSNLITENVTSLHFNDDYIWRNIRRSDGTSLEAADDTSDARTKNSPLIGQTLLCPTQKRVSTLKELIERYSKPGDIVADMFAGTLSTARACMEISEHRVFVGCDLDKECVTCAMPLVYETFARQLLDLKSTIRGDTEAHHCASQFLDHPLQQRRLSAAICQLGAPDGLVMYQKLPDYLHQFLCQTTITARHDLLGSRSMDGDNGTAKSSENSLMYTGRPDEWPLPLRQWFESMPESTLRAVETCTLSLEVKPSLIQHQWSGLGLFTRKGLARRERICAYYGTVLYTDLSSAGVVNGKRDMSYGRGVLQVDRRSFEKYGVGLAQRAKCSRGAEHPVYIYPAPFCCARFINDPRRLDDDEGAENREANVCIVEELQHGFLEADMLESPELLVVRALRDIEAGEELYIEYHNDYSCWEC